MTLCDELVKGTQPLSAVPFATATPKSIVPALSSPPLTASLTHVLIALGELL
jgi:hypothetical protein